MLNPPPLIDRHITATAAERRVRCSAAQIKANCVPYKQISGAPRLKLLSLTEVADRVGICRRTINRMIETGVGPTITAISPRRRLVTEDDYLAWCDSLRRPTRAAAPLSEVRT